MTRIFRILLLVFTFVALTIFTQVGGIILLICIWISRKFRLTGLRSIALFLVSYLSFTLLITPIIAPVFGRSALPLNGVLRPLNFITCLSNRHYVNKGLKDELISIANHVNKQFVNTKTNYLDANFPFFDGFPLFPHLSHNDGKKVDIAFYYIDSETFQPVDGNPSIIGYGVFVDPLAHEYNQPDICEKRGYWQYGVMQSLIPQSNKTNYKLDLERTALLINFTSSSNLVQKIFIEPHLKSRMNLTSSKIRYHGCHAVRHDDHVHIQIK